MSQGIDPERLGERLHKVRKDRNLTLKDVEKKTDISIATLSRIERGDYKNLKSDTLVVLTNWIGTSVETLQKEPRPVMRSGKPVTNTPDIVELHLRADKRLKKKTAIALANLFRSVYEQVAEQMKQE